MVARIEQCQVACDQLIDMTGRAAIQAVLQLSAMEAAGGPQQQRKRRPARRGQTGPHEVYLTTCLYMLS